MNLPPLPAPDERTRRGLAFSGFAMERYARQAIAEVVIDMVLYCPKCGMQHIDEPEPSMLANDVALYGGDWPNRWTNPPHRSHLCAGCGHIWRPSDTATNGVLRTASGKDADTVPSMQVQQEAPSPGLQDSIDELRKQIKLGIDTLNKKPGKALRTPELLLREGRKFMCGEPSLCDQLTFDEALLIKSLL